VRELGLGARFAVTGRPGWTRTLLTAVGVGMGVAMLLLAASVPHLMAEQDARGDARAPAWADGPPGADSVLLAMVHTEYRGEWIGGLELQPVAGADTEVEPPPGLDGFPAPGEMVVSPALGELLDSAEGALLAERLDYARAGTIGDEGLEGPGELLYYVGGDSLDPAGASTDGFGIGPIPGSQLPPALVLLVVVLCVVLLVPVAVFIATAVRFGGERRDQRLAALRLVGADADMTRRVAAGETLVGAVFGLVLGVGLFLGLRQFLGTVTVWEFSAFPADITPTVPFTVLIVLAVPFAAVAVSLFALRGIAIEPLGVVRESPTGRRRVGWRLAPAALGLLLLAPMVGSFDGGSQFGQFQAGLGVVLLLVGATVLLPWLVESVVGRLGGGPVSWQLAIRRLQLSSGTAARTVSGITVAVAGATALYMLFAGARAEETESTGKDPARAQLEVSAWETDARESAELIGRLESQPGVTATLGSLSGYGLVPGTQVRDEDLPTLEVTVADCATLREMLWIEQCANGDAFMAASGPSQAAGLPEPGGTIDLGVDSGGERVTPGPRMWTVPEGTATVEARVDPLGVEISGVLATPGALDPGLITDGMTRVLLRTDPAVRDAIEHVRNTAWASEGRPGVWEVESEQTSDDLQDIQRALLIGATGVMGLIAASMIVSMLEQLRERRRLLSVLVAFGTRRRTLGASVLWQTAVPVVLGLALAAMVGTGMGALLMSMVNIPVTGWLAFLPMTAVGAGMIAVVTLASLPLLWRLMRPDGLRTE
jgi:hypothetical protein